MDKNTAIVLAGAGLVAGAIYLATRQGQAEGTLPPPGPWPPTPVEGRNVLYGIVTDFLTGATIPGAIVHLTNAPTPDGTFTLRTDSLGRYATNNLYPGTTVISASKIGFQGYTNTLILETQVTRWDINLVQINPPGNADAVGTIIDNTGQPMVGANVRFTGKSGQGEFLVSTNGSGYYQLPGVPAGGYVINIAVFGFEAISQDVTLVDGTNTFDFQLVPTLIAGNLEPQGTVLSIGEKTYTFSPGQAWYYLITSFKLRWHNTGSQATRGRLVGSIIPLGPGGVWSCPAVGLNISSGQDALVPAGGYGEFIINPSPLIWAAQIVGTLSDADTGQVLQSQDWDPQAQNALAGITAPVAPGGAVQGYEFTCPIG